MNDDVSQLRAEVSARFGVAVEEVRVVRAPYRICPLGAHVDHQLGVVTAMAINRGVLLAYARTQNGVVRLLSRTFAGEVTFELNNVPDCRSGDWGNFPRGAARALQQQHRLQRGIVGITTGSIHEGGLSSSAAIGVACLLALESANELPISREENIVLDQQIENDYLGLRNGILDQAAILMSRREQLTVVDCRDKQYRVVPSLSNRPPFAILLAFSGLKQALVTTDYNRCVEECTTAAKTLLAAVGRPNDKPVLRSVTPEEYELHCHWLKGAEAKRAEHFFSEATRVQRGLTAWKSGDLREFGRLISASGESSIVNYECGSPPLVDLYEILLRTPGVYGTRFSGAGFRGCCLAIIDPAATSSAVAHVQTEYANQHPDLAKLADPPTLCETADGAEEIERT